MQCAEFEDHLNEVLDRRARVAADPLLQDHAARCEECRLLMDSLTMALGALDEHALPELSPQFARGVVQKARSGRSQRLRAVGVALAASAAVLGVVALSFRDTNEVAPGAVIAEVKGSSKVQPAAPVGAIAREATDRYMLLASATRAHVSDAMRIVPGFEHSDETATAANSTSSSGWFDGVSAGVRPFTETTADAIGTLFDALPQPSSTTGDAAS